MTWRSVMVSRPSSLHIKQGCLVVRQDIEVRIPVEDIAVLILDHREITLTHSVLSACSEAGVAIYSTGANHLPSGVHLPYLAHNRSTRRWRQQHSLSRPRIKQLWAIIIRRKLENQAKCLELARHSGVEQLESLARRVRSGDPENLESQGAVVHFRNLFGVDFTRQKNVWINGALNYGYAVFRGAVARALVGLGLHPTIGLFHDSERNPLNLADDFIEPLRPIIDLHVGSQPQRKDQSLQAADKAALIGLLNVEVSMPRGNTSVLSAINQMLESYVSCLENPAKPVSLELPMLLGLSSHAIE